MAQSSQDPPATRRRGLDGSEKIDVFYSFEPAHSANGQLRQRALNITFGLPIRSARFLSDSVIQDELELSNGEVESLKDITNSFNQFNEKLRWDRASRAESVKVTAQTKIDKFERDLLAFLDSDRLKDKDRERLDQLWRQFVVLGRSNVRSVASPYQRSLELLNLTEEQRANAKTIVDEELGDLLKFSRVLKEVRECLNSSNREKLDQLLTKRQFEDISPLVAIAQAMPMYSPTSESQSDRQSNTNEDSPGAKLNKISLMPLVIIFNGTWAVEDEYLESGLQLKTFRRWVNFLRWYERGALDWLEISGTQADALSSLTIRTMNEETGIARVTYYGHEPLSRVQWIDNPTVDQYRKYQSDFRSALEESDVALGKRIEQILLPHQLDLIRQVLALNRVPDLGVYHLLLEGELNCQLSDSEHEKLLVSQSRRLEVLKTCFRKIDERCVKLLSQQQQDAFRSEYGEWASIYPPYWVLLEE